MNGNPTYNSDLLIADLRLDEGVRAEIYRDTMGHPSIGVGHNLDASPLPEGWTPPLTDSQINALLAHDIGGICTALDHNPAFAGWWRTTPERVQRVIIELGFNMGVGTLATFHQFIGFLRVGSYSAAAGDLLHTRWATQVGARAQRVAQRLMG